MKRLTMLLAAAATVALAQPEHFEVPLQAGEIESARAHAVEFVRGEFGIGGQVVKNAPYSAEAVTETIQVLADGNRIVHRNLAQVARDSEGRTRRDATFAGFGMLAGAEGPKTSFIHDPVTNTSITLDHNSKTARKMKGHGFMVHSESRGPANVAIATAGGVRVAGPGPMILERTAGIAHVERKHAGKEESLGKRNIEGVMAEGTRIVETIPAGEIGNERPIEILSERWYSPELQTLVMTSHKDPRVGETTYKLTGIQRGEPARSLFEAPADYTVKEAEVPNIRILRDKIEKPKE